MAESMEEYVARVEGQGVVLPAATDPAGGERSLAQARKDEEDLQTEGEIVDKLRANANDAARIEATLLQRVGEITDKDQLPSALRAVADVKSKSIDGLVKLTGRDGQAPADDFAAMLRGMAESGFLRLNVSLEAGPETSGDG